jgi:hypothetical protein
LEEEYLGKLNAGNRHTKEFSRPWKTSRLRKRDTWESLRLRTGTSTFNNPRKGNIFPAKKSFVSDIPALSRESFLDYRLSYSVGMDIFLRA